MNLTTVAHHLTLLELPPELDEAVKSGRCTSPRTPHELSKLRDEQPEQVQALLASGAEITRAAASELRARSERGAPTETVPPPSDKLIDQANAACDRLERALGRIKPSNSSKVALPELIALRIRVEDITKPNRSFVSAASGPVLSEVRPECESASPHFANARQDGTELTLWVEKRKSRFPSRTRLLSASVKHLRSPLVSGYSWSSRSW